MDASREGVWQLGGSVKCCLDDVRFEEEGLVVSGVQVDARRGASSSSASRFFILPLSLEGGNGAGSGECIVISRMAELS